MNVVTQLGALFQRPSGTPVFGAIVLSMLISLLTAALTAALYRLFYDERATGSQVQRSFLLIGPAITALFLAIQYSLPLSLGLVGALTIIRFRTPIKEPEEVGFIVLLIACAVVCATFDYRLLAVLLGCALIGLAARRFLPLIGGSSRRDGVMLVTLESPLSPEGRLKVNGILASRLRNARLQSVSLADGLTTLHYSFTTLEGDGLATLERELGEVTPVRKLNVFYNRHGLVG